MVRLKDRALPYDSRYDFSQQCTLFFFPDEVCYYSVTLRVCELQAWNLLNLEPKKFTLSIACTMTCRACVLYFSFLFFLISYEIGHYLFLICPNYVQNSKETLKYKCRMCFLSLVSKYSWALHCSNAQAHRKRESIVSPTYSACR